VPPEEHEPEDASMSHWAVKVGLDRIDPDFPRRIREANPTEVQEVIPVGPQVFIVEPKTGVDAKDFAEQLTPEPGIAYAYPVLRDDAPDT
jgi:hypothetical protein